MGISAHALGGYNPMQSVMGFETVTSVMKEIGDVLKEKVLLTPESDPDHPFLEYDPQSRNFIVVQSS